jgi:class 3 adenylate cyclase
LLAAGERRALQAPLEPGRYRLRALQLRGGQTLIVTPDGASSADIALTADGNPQAAAGTDVRVNLRPALTVENTTGQEQLCILEHMAWTDQATTAAEVTQLQVFRDLFAREALRPGQQFSVGSLAILFTDLRRSTQLYREVGDAVAFGLVMNHFDVLRTAIAAEDGVIVKTIGDAVMAIFRRPAGAVRAILKAQQELAHPPAGMHPLGLKAGIHYGSCIAVTLNDRLDYFGSTVNIAARLEGLSTGEDVILSAAVRADPEVDELLAADELALTAEPFVSMLKGLDTEMVELYRVRPSAVAAEAGHVLSPPAAGAEQ